MKKNGKRYLDIDYIQFFLGDATVPVMKQDKVCGTWAEPGSDCYPIDGFYIKNVNPLIRTFEISSNAKFYLEHDTGANVAPNRKAPFSEFKLIFTASGSEHLKSVPYYIFLDSNNVIMDIVEQFLP